MDNKKVALKYKEAAMSKEPVKTKFVIYGQEKETTYTHQAYKGKPRRASKSHRSALGHDQ